MLVQVHADYLGRLAQRFGIDGKAAGVAAEVEHAPPGTEARQRLAIVPLIEEKPRLVLAAGRYAKADAVLGNNLRRRRLRRSAIERFLFLHVLFGEPIKPALREVARKNLLNFRAEAIHPRGKKLQHDD